MDVAGRGGGVEVDEVDEPLRTLDVGVRTRRD